MFVRRLIAIAALALAAFAPSASSLAQAQRAAADWSKTVTALPNGAFLVGNPQAKTRLVEYFAYTCPHCADFAAESGELRTRWIKSGAVAIEYRNYVLNAVDIPIGQLARCGGAAKFLSNHDAIYDHFDSWTAGLQKWIAENGSSLQGKPPEVVLPQIVKAAGLTALIAKNGLSPAALDKCLADKQAIATITNLSAGAWDADPGFSGTPGFILNNKPASGVHNWASLKPLLPPLPASAN